MKNIKLLTLLILSGLVFLSGCDTKKTSRSSPARVARGGNTQPYYLQGGYNNQGGYNQGGYNQGGYNGTSTSQWAYLQANDASTFFRAVQGLVSASMNPQELGSVNNYGDVAIIGYIDMDQSGNINPNNSRLRLEIWDDYARSGQASEIALAFNSLTNSSYNGNQMNLIFQDNFGQIVISGQINQNNFYGTVSFQNSVSFDGTSAPAAGVLGNFQVPACGFFRCQ